MAARTAEITRNTKETQITARVNLDGVGCYHIQTGIGFLDHMLQQLSRHSLLDIDLAAQGDLHVDMHHTTEDTGIVLGEAVREALGDFSGIRRYGHALIPMDETCTRVSLDVSRRPHLTWKVNLPQGQIGQMDNQLFHEWFQAFAISLGLTLHVELLYGENTHHIVESCYKGLARALKDALEIDPRMAGQPPSTKEAHITRINK